MKRQFTKFSLLRPLACLGISIFVVTPLASAEVAERDAEAAKKAARGESPELQEPKRPAHMPDLTTRDKLSEAARKITWNMGPTGIIGIKNGGMAGDQIRVLTVMPGSPAEGKVKPGDVILSVGGKDFEVGGHLGRDVGNAIIEAEEPQNKGILKMHIWRDRNWDARNNAKDMGGVDIEELFRKAEEDADLYEWKDEEEKAAAAASQAYDEFPIDGDELNITLQLNVMGTYSDTSPWDCPVAEKIREDAWKLLAKRFKADKRGRKRARWLDAVALVASGKPEYRKLVHDWARQQNICRDMGAEPRLEDMSYKGMQSWHHGFAPLEIAIYYDATGDEFVLPELRKRAILAAKGQNRGGSWGHTFAFPGFNGGKLHGRNPGYGAMNNAGTRCFFLLTLAKKAGIEHPEIDLAIKRASRFFGTYVDKGTIPYGFHAPWPSDDSNGKNYGAAYAFNVLGKTREAKYFHMLSTHASFTRRGGHGSPTLWHYTPLSSHGAGPQGVQAAMRNMRWFYTLARRHDGSFVMQGEQAGIGGKPSRSPTATYALYYSAPLKQLVNTGKDVDKSLWFTDEELEELFVSARPQIGDPVLLERIGKPWKERNTDKLFELLDHFYPNMRRAVAKELGKRYKAGEKNIVPRLIDLLDNEESRYRDGALYALMNCDAAGLKSALPKVKELLKNDPAEFVRMRAVNALAKATKPGDSERQRLLLQAAAEDYPGMSTDVANVRTAVKNTLFGRGSGKTKLHTAPFETGLDKDLVRTALEKIVTMDPGGIVPGGWNKETVTRLAGPIVYVADEKQFNDAMFGGARTSAARNKLQKLGVREMVECDLINTMKHSCLERDLRRTVTFVHGRYSGGYGRYLNPLLAEKFPEVYHKYLPELRQVLQDKPLTTIFASEARGTVPLGELIRELEVGKELQTMPSLAGEVDAMFKQELANCADTAERVALCRKELANPDRKNYFRMMAAMSALVDILEPAAAVKDLVPYFGHEHWRIRRHARAVGLKMVKGGAGQELIKALDDATGEHAGAILDLLAEAGVDAALEPARKTLKKKGPLARKAAIEALAILGGERVLPEVFTFMSEATNPDDLSGCEHALLSHAGEGDWDLQVSKKAAAMLPKSESKVRRSLYWVLAQLGGQKNMATLKSAAAQAAGGHAKEDTKEFNDIIIALSYSPDRDADRVILTLARQNRKKEQLVARQSVRRMVTGPDGIGHVSDETKLDLAVPMVKLTHNGHLIAYMGQIHRGRCVKALSEIMEKGAAQNASKAVIAAASGMEKAPPDERKIAAEGIRNVIEYIEVTRLRGGISAHMEKEDKYLYWKDYQNRAGKILLKLDEPDEKPMPGFDNMDLDL